MSGCRACDGLYDASRIIHDPNGGVYLEWSCQNYAPHKKQVDCISKENIVARWIWAKNQLKKPEATDNEFRAFLIEQEYMYKAL
jgi:hypothetical protein